MVNYICFIIEGTIILLYVSGFVMPHTGGHGTVSTATSTASPIESNHWYRGRRREGWKLPQETRNVKHADSEAECFLDCRMAGPNCSGVYFRKAERLCKHLFGVRTYLRQGTSNDVVIFGPRLISFYATTKYNDGDGFTFDFPTAVSVCGEFNARLSNRTELQEMYADGVKHCWCAWLLDGTQGYVNQGKCSSNLGVFYDCRQTLAHAWCTMIG